ALVDTPAERLPWPGQYASLCNNVAWHFVRERPKTRLPDAILRLAEKAIALEPENVFYQNTYGITLYRLGRHEDAVRCLEKNVAHSQQYAAFDLYFLAMSYERLGQPAKARACFDRANAAVETETSLSASHRQELADFRAEAEEVLGIVRRR